MKSSARGHCWCPGIDSSIEKVTIMCENCLLRRKNSPEVVKHVWEPATQAFQRMHVDFAGPFMSHYFSILVDAHFKGPEVHIVKDMLAKTTISTCREIFNRYGLPNILISDPGRTFELEAFETF